MKIPSYCSEHIYGISFVILGIQQIAVNVKGQIEDFKPNIPLIQALRAPGMRNRHWEEVC